MRHREFVILAAVSKADQFTRRRLRSSYASVVVSISLVLFMLGLLGVLLVNAQNLAREVKENFAFQVMLKNEAKEVEVKQFQKSLDLKPYVKSTEYIDKEEAAKKLQEDLDEEFLDFLGYNPLMNSIEIHLRADFVTNEEIASIAAELEEQGVVREVVYDKPLIELMNENLQRISLVLLGGSLLLLVIAVALINSSIRLSIYSKRFLIKTMQLVGATRSFIRLPFIKKSLLHGFIGALIALALLTGVLVLIGREVPHFAELQDPLALAMVYVAVVLVGLLISGVSTFLAMGKYLKLKTDELYF